MGQIIIPSALSELLDRNPSLSAAVQTTISRFEPWLATNLPFFPEYTDHGPAHISSVLAAADALIRDEARPALTPEDAAVLILAALLHDSAMHLTPDSFLTLIDPNSPWNQHPLIAPLDTKTWPQLFDDFFADARRWDGRKLHQILGDADKSPDEEEDLSCYIRRPDTNRDPEHWDTTKYRKFLADFVRCFHHRLAHEIARYRVPPAANMVGRTLLSDFGAHACITPPSLPPELPHDLADLAGLVARSHGMPLRDTFAYLDRRFHARVTCAKSHPVFLMAVLRIADFLQMQPERANSTLAAVQKIRSPLSRDEWRKHFAIDEIIWPHEQDAEAVFIRARPESARIFIGLRRRLTELQAELDTSWAVLGEVFSKQKPVHASSSDLSQLGLALRRVRSNLDDPDQFVKDQNPDYYPIEAKFDTAGADLLKLLIGPLYSDRPQIGIRELLQNSLDAVHEVRQYCKDHGIDINTLPFTDHKADVLISIDKDEEGDHWLTVSDKGIGMSPEVLRDYFLRVGASFRASDSWRKQYELHGKSKVLRSGRFGVGVLAAFLLGPAIEVHTRYVRDRPNEAVWFRASIDADVLELRTLAKPHVGTVIRVRIGSDVYARLRSDRAASWDWYTLADPAVDRLVDGESIGQESMFPACCAALPSNWRRVRHQLFQDIQWTYLHRDRFACNGIRLMSQYGIGVVDESGEVGHSYHDDHPTRWSVRQIPFAVPSISVFDANAQLRLSLTRDELLAPMPFEAVLIADMTKMLCALLLVHCPHSHAEQATPRASAGNVSDILDRALFRAHDGFSLLHPWHLQQLDAFDAIWMAVPNLWEHPVSADTDPCSCLCISRHTLELLIEGGFRGDCVGLSFGEHAAAEMLIPADWWRVDAHSLWLKQRGKWRDGIWESGKISKNSQRPLHALSQSGRLASNPTRWYAHFYFPSTFTSVAETPFVSVWREVMRHPVIPYDPDERKKKFAHAYEALKEYIEAWQTPNLPGWRGELVRRLRGNNT